MTLYVTSKQTSATRQEDQAGCCCCLSCCCCWSCCSSAESLPLLDCCCASPLYTTTASTLVTRVHSYISRLIGTKFTCRLLVHVQSLPAFPGAQPSRTTCFVSRHELLHVLHFNSRCANLPAAGRIVMKTMIFHPPIAANDYTKGGGRTFKARIRYKAATKKRYGMASV